MTLDILSLWKNKNNIGFHLLHIDNRRINSSLLYMDWTKGEEILYIDIFYFEFKVKLGGKP